MIDGFVVARRQRLERECRVGDAVGERHTDPLFTEIERQCGTLVDFVFYFVGDPGSGMAGFRADRGQIDTEQLRRLLPAVSERRVENNLRIRGRVQP